MKNILKKSPKHHILAVLLVLTIALNLIAFSDDKPQLNVLAAMSTKVVSFDDVNLRNGAPLNGGYPAGVIDWQSNVWMVSDPWGGFTTKNVSFYGPALKQASLKVLSASTILSSVETVNGGKTSATITLTCAGNPTVSKTMSAGQKANLVTNWTTYCSQVTIASSVGWDVNFDNFTFTTTLAPVPTATATSAPIVTPMPTATPTSIPVNPDKQPGIGGSSGCVNLAVESKPYDSGMNETFICPGEPNGKTLSILTYGATVNNSSDDDAVSIQKTINAASAGDTVSIPSGTYHLKSGPILLKTGVNIRGDSNSTSILSTVLSSEINAVFSTTTTGVENFTLSNFRINKYSGSDALAGVRLGTGSWQPTASNSVVVSRVIVENLQIEGYQRFGIQIENGKNILVQNNRILNATAESVGEQGYGVMIGMSASSNNWVRNNDIGPNIRHAYLLQYRAHHNLFEYNIARGTSNDSFDFHGEKEYSNEVRYNLVDGCNLALNPGSSISAFGVGEVPSGNDFSICHTTSGAHCDTGPNNWIHHNTARGCKTGVRVNLTNNIIVEDNNISNMTQNGIAIGDLAQSNNISMKRNKTTSSSIGILLGKTSNSSITGSISTGNIRYGLSTSGNSETVGYTITGNDFRSNTSGINLRSTNGIFINNQQ